MEKRAKAGGRKAGTPNKVSVDLRYSVQLLLTDQWPEFMRRLSHLDDDAYCRVVCSLLPYVIPKQKEVQITAPEVGGFRFVVSDNTDEQPT